MSSRSTAGSSLGGSTRSRIAWPIHRSRVSASPPCATLPAGPSTLPTPSTPAKYVYAHGQSQTGRFLREFLYLGFNADERERLVFDGVIAHIAGAARIDINRRGSTPTAGNAFVGTFPFSDRAQRDPVTGATEGLLENDRARRHQPKLFLTNSSVEYWIDTGRAAALIHTTPDGDARRRARRQRSRLPVCGRPAHAGGVSAAGRRPRPAAREPARLYARRCARSSSRSTAG